MQLSTKSWILAISSSYCKFWQVAAVFLLLQKIPECPKIISCYTNVFSWAFAFPLLRIYEKKSYMQQSCYTNVFPWVAFANLPENGDAEIFIRLLKSIPVATEGSADVKTKPRWLLQQFKNAWISCKNAAWYLELIYPNTICYKIMDFSNFKKLLPTLASCCIVFQLLQEIVGCLLSMKRIT